MLWESLTLCVSSFARVATSEDILVNSSCKQKYVWPRHKLPAALLLGMLSSQGHGEAKKPTHFNVLDNVPHMTTAFGHGQCRVPRSSGSGQASGQHQHTQAGKAAMTRIYASSSLSVAASTELHIACTHPYGHLA